MTRIASLIVLIAMTIVHAAAQESWVRQTDLSNNMIYDIPLGATGGNFTAPLPVGEQGSLFELFARGTAWDTNVYLLDTKLIRAYSPTVEVAINSEDSYVRGDPASSNFVRRTRADRPFSMQIKVAHLVTATTASQAEREVYFSSQGRVYDSETFSGLEQEPFLLHESDLENGTYTLPGLYHELPSNQPANGCGEQTYTFVRYAADGVPDTILMQPKIEIWPVARAAAQNIAQSQLFIDRIPSIILDLTNLYPDSRTYAQIYSGSSVLGTVGTLINGTERRYGRYYNPDQAEEPTNVPQNVSISIDDLSNYAAADGIYTLEVITETPFFSRAPERLLSVTFEVDRVISSRGQLTTAEKPGP